MMKTRTLLAALMLATVSIAHAAESEKWPMVIPAPHGSVILPDQDAKWSYDNFRYAAVRRVDNTLYISGVVIGPRAGEKRDAEAFKDVVMINSFHAWEGPNFEGTKDRHFALFDCSGPTASSRCS